MDEKMINHCNLCWRLVFLVLALAIIMIGANFNFIALTNNNCKMPVKTQYGVLEEDTHFQYTDSKTINYSYLTDIIPIKSARMSIGDIFMFGGFAFAILNICWIIKILTRRENDGIK